MRHVFLLCGGLVCAILLIGCEKKEQSTTPPAAGQAPASNTQLPKIDTEAAKAAIQDAATDVPAKINQVMDQIKDKKYDLADAGLKELEARKASLPEAIQKQLERARMALDAAKSGNVKVPDLPATPK